MNKLNALETEKQQILDSIEQAQARLQASFDAQRSAKGFAKMNATRIAVDNATIHLQTLMRKLDKVKKAAHNEYWDNEHIYRD